MNVYVLYAGCFFCFSWRHGLPNLFQRLWQHSWPGYYLSIWWLFLPYSPWYIRKTIVCITSAILVQIYFIRILYNFIPKRFLWFIQNTSRPGSIQARGDNLFSILKAFTNSSQLQNAHDKTSLEANANLPDGESAVFFDYLTIFMVCYKICDKWL